MQVSKEVIAGTLANVEKLAREDFARGGYNVDEFISIQDLGFTTRRLWLVTAEVTHKEAK